jgi:1,4-alpha-glucan branching enzyme
MARSKKNRGTIETATIPHIIYGVSRFTDEDIYYFRQGTHCRLYEKLGAHVMQAEGLSGTYFAVWAPDAERVSVIGEFNGWRPGAHELAPRWDSSGIWEGFIPNVGHGTLYKYHVSSRYNGYSVEKSDPFAYLTELPPKTASVVWDMTYRWSDDRWMERRGRANSLSSPISVYEVHPGSWRRVPEDGNRSLSYREMAPVLAEYVNEMGFTHVEFMPVMEHPFYASWGYQVTGYYAPTCRYGTPQDFMYLVDYLHEHGIGVFLDWVPSHFPSDLHGLVFFDGTDLFEHVDDRKGFHPDWKSHIFNYGRHEVRSFLISSALFWLDRYHADGLRVDAVASMLYLDYSRGEGEWEPNQFGGRENLEAISFLKQLNQTVYEQHPDVQMIAEESTAWPQVSRPVSAGGLGFGMKWNMGWMHDMLTFFGKEPVHRKYHHDDLTFCLLYAFTENFMLSLSHDEVVHGKGALINKMPGDLWQQFANLRLLYGYMYAQPGKKLLFMGGEFGQRSEWNHDTSLDWHVLQYTEHRGVQEWVRDLNSLYRREPALHEQDFSCGGFTWIDFADRDSGIVSFVRRGNDGREIVVVCNFTPVPRWRYRVGFPSAGRWQEVLNSDADRYGGSNQGNAGGIEVGYTWWQHQPGSAEITVPPLGILFFRKA